MDWKIWAGIVVVAFVIFIIIMRKRNKNSSSGGSLLSQARSRVKKIGDCCRKFLGKLGGGA